MSREEMEVREAAAGYAAQAEQDVPPGYKRTEVGVIPGDWNVATIFKIAGESKQNFDDGDWVEAEFLTNSGVRLLQTGNIGVGKFIDKESRKYISGTSFDSLRCKEVRPGDLLICRLAEPAGRACIAPDLGESRMITAVDVTIFRPLPSLANVRYLVHVFSAPRWLSEVKDRCGGSTRSRIARGELAKIKVPLPSLIEQRAIATALSDVDALITALDRLIAKKRAIKTAAMQQLLTGKTRLPGFSGEWETKRLGEITDCLDNLRVPLNESQRKNMPGPYPYCGANGVLDFVGDYVIDDDVILIAEDGGYFDEYAHRPIAYRMKGKIWVNNHAHVIKAKNGFSQGFIFYSLVHKNILPYLASGTRAKLNKSEMNKIEVLISNNKMEQEAIAQVLSDMDAEIAALEARRDKTRAIKQGMMQELLTGRTRLVEPETIEAA